MTDNSVEAAARSVSLTTVAAWIVGGVLSVLCASVVGLVIYEEWEHATREKLDSAQVWPLDGGGFSVAVRDQWAVAKIGSYSDGSAVAEFAMRDYRSVVAFDQKGQHTPTEIARFRRDDFFDEFPKGACQQKRWLREDTLEHRSELMCTARSFGDPYVLMSLSIEDGDRHLEIFGDVNSSSSTEQQAVALLRRLGAGVRMTEAVPEDD